MRINRMFYPVHSLGYGERIGLWVQGCRRRCPGCESPEMRSPDGGIIREPEKLFDEIPDNFPVDGLTISGGEPFDQKEDLLSVLKVFKEKYTNDILIFTGYTREELLEMKDDTIRKILTETAVLVDGRYIEELNDGKGLRGSSNQHIYINRYQERYQDAENRKRTLQAARIQDQVVIIGIPPK